jgi:pimeloyl-ACP methyl ester carboxylesterase
MKQITLLSTLLLSFALFGQATFQYTAENLTQVSNEAAITPITATLGYQGYDEVQEYFGQGEYEIFLDNVDGVLDKPVILLDGFDPGDSRDINGLYNSLAFGGENLADLVRDEGYDIVVLNAPVYNTNGKDIDGGGDFIQRNAMVLIELINFLNDEKVGDEELVVLGPSMGGLIARYGLAFMEQNSIPHETRLYISFDSPHKGANIPISLQYLINYLAQELGDAQAIALVDEVLNSPAAKEMLYDHLLGHLLAGSTTDQDPTKLLPAGAPDFRDPFQAELDALGFPQDSRNVAMINGTANGLTTGMPGMQVVDTTLDLGVGATADVVLNFAPEANVTINVTSFDTFFIGIPVDTFDANAQGEPTIDGIDASPGGVSFISNALGGGGGNPIIQDFIDALDQDAFSFIPSISSLALETENDWFAIPDLDDSPFVNFHIPNTNERHVEPTEQNVAFALSEILQTPLAISENELSGAFQLVRNPVAETIEILVDSSVINGSVVIAEIYNQLGQQLVETTVSVTSSIITISQALPTGMYFLRLSTSSGPQTLKFLVK